MNLLLPALLLSLALPVRAIELNGREFSVAEGYTLSVAAPASLVERPVEASFDDKGRLYVTESSGSNEAPAEQLKKQPHRLLRLEDTNGDGVFDRRTVFADRLMFPEGVLWHQGVVYVAAPPQIWKFTDADDDGIAEKREVWHDGKTLTGCANDLHGPYAGPDGFLYWCKGAFAEQTHDLPGKPGWTSRASHVFRMKPDGTEFDSVFTAGMDNPVGLAWLPEGDLIVSGTFLQHPGDGRRDGLIHAVRGGVWGKDHDVLDGHPRTGPLLPAMTHLGPAAPCGMCRYGDRGLLVCQFNLRKVSAHVLSAEGATWKTAESDFLTCDHPDFHPTDVLQAPDGSILVVDTGGWYKLCCPTSQVAKPDVPGCIYRLRKTGGEIPVACPEPHWKLDQPDNIKALSGQLQSPNPHLRRLAAERLGELGRRDSGWAARHPDVVAALLRTASDFSDRFLTHALISVLLEMNAGEALAPVLAESREPVAQAAALYVLSQTTRPAALAQQVVRHLASPVPEVREAAVFALRKVPAWREAAGPWLAESLATPEKPEALRAAVEAVAAEDPFRRQLGPWLAAAKSAEVKRMLLEVMAGAGASYADEWTEPLTTVLDLPSGDLPAKAAAVFATMPPPKDHPVQRGLRAKSREAQTPPEVRLSLMLAAGGISPDSGEFLFLVRSLTEPRHADAAARILARAGLNPDQLALLVPALETCGLLQRPVLLRAWARSSDEALGLAVVAQLEKANALAGISAQDLAEGLGKFPDSVRQRLGAARDRLNAGAAEQKARLDELESSLPAGDARRGKVVFQSAKASCVLCHQAGYLGKPVGPDLTKIGGIRTRRDLLEAIAFPSASFVRSYEPVEVKRKDGSLAYGIPRRQSPESLTLLTGAVTPELTIPAADIASLQPGTASLMPQGLDRILSPAELADLVAFLQSLK